MVSRPNTTFQSSDLEPHDLYKLLTGLVVPRPIAWVGSLGGAGSPNLAPFSFFNVVAATPPTVMFAVTGQPDARKDTLANVERSGEFTLSEVSADLIEPMNHTSIDAPASQSEFDLAGLTPVQGTLVGAPYVGEASAAMECRVVEIVDVGHAPMGSRVVFGEVLCFHVADALLDGTRIDQTALRAVGRCVGGLYAVADDHLHLTRPSMTP